jgi:hypothetical protein
MAQFFQNSSRTGTIIVTVITTASWVVKMWLIVHIVPLISVTLGRRSPDFRLQSYLALSKCSTCSHQKAIPLAG